MKKYYLISFKKDDVGISPVTVDSPALDTEEEAVKGMLLWTKLLVEDYIQPVEAFDESVKTARHQKHVVSFSGYLRSISFDLVSNVKTVRIYMQDKVFYYQVLEIDSSKWITRNGESNE